MMARYVDADELKHSLSIILDTLKNGGFVDGVRWTRALIDAIDITPTANVAEVKHGQFVSELVKKCDWKGKPQNYYQPHSCSCCHTALKGTENYCPNCGAKMDGGK